MRISSLRLPPPVTTLLRVHRTAPIPHRPHTVHLFRAPMPTGRLIPLSPEPLAETHRFLRPFSATSALTCPVFPQMARPVPSGSTRMRTSQMKFCPISSSLPAVHLFPLPDLRRPLNPALFPFSAKQRPRRPRSLLSLLSDLPRSNIPLPLRKPHRHPSLRQKHLSFHPIDPLPRQR